MFEERSEQPAIEVGRRARLGNPDTRGTSRGLRVTDRLEPRSCGKYRPGLTQAYEKTPAIEVRHWSKRFHAAHASLFRGSKNVENDRITPDRKSTRLNSSHV